MNGFINLLKPPGMSSGAAVAVAKRLTVEKVGHAGTLDPEAAGVLPLMVGRAGRLLDYFTDKSKSYVAEISFGGATDTQDAQGVILEPGRRIPSREEILAALPRFTGRILQRPPAYSALKRDGVPLYALARKGQMVETAPRETEIRALELGEKTGTDGYMLSVDCGRGTYIRTLCHDLGQALNAPAHMRFLLRTRHGDFRLEQAVTVEELQAAAEAGTLASLLLPLDAPVQGLMRVDVPGKFARLARNGGKLPAQIAPGLSENQRCRLYLQGEFLGVGHRAGELLRFDVGMAGAEAE